MLWLASYVFSRSRVASNAGFLTTAEDCEDVGVRESRGEMGTPYPDDQRSAPLFESPPTEVRSPRGKQPPCRAQTRLGGCQHRGPAAEILDQADVDVIEVERQRQTRPADALATSVMRPRAGGSEKGS